MAGLNRWGLGFIFSARDLATPTFRVIRKELTGMAGDAEGVDMKLREGFKQLGKGIAIAAIGAVGLKIMDNLADRAGEFEIRMAAVREITGATPEVFERLRQSAMDAGLAMTQFSPTDAAEGLRIFAQAGFSAQSSMNALMPTLDIAAASFGQLSLANATGLAVTGLKLFGLDADQSTYMMDRLAKATVMSSIQFKELPLALGVAARGVIAVNASLEDTLIGLGLVRNIIPTTERAATAFATSLEKLASGKEKKQIEALGVQIEELGTGKFRPVLNIIGDLSGRLAEMGEVERAVSVQAIFGKRSMAGLLTIYRQLTTAATKLGGVTRENLSKAIENLRDKMRNATGTAKKLRDAAIYTWKGMKMVIKAQIEGLMIAVGEGIAKGLEPVTELFANIVNRIAKAFASLPMGLKEVVAITMAIGFAATVVTGLVTALYAASSLLAMTAIGGLAGLLAIFGEVFLVIAAVAAAGSALYFSWETNFGGIRDLIMPIVDDISLVMDSLIMLFSTGGYLSEDLGTKLMDSPLLGFVTSVYMAGVRVKAFFEVLFVSLQSGWGYVSDAIAPAFEAIWGVFSAIGDQITELFGVFAELIGFTSTGSDSWRTFGRIVGDVITVVAVGLAWVLKIAIIPTLTHLSTGIRIATKLLGPLVKMIYYTGKIILKVLFWPITLMTGGFKTLLDDLKRGFSALVQFLVNLGKSALALLLAPFVAIMKILPESWRAGWMQDIINFQEQTLLGAKPKTPVSATPVPPQAVTAVDTGMATATAAGRLGSKTSAATAVGARFAEGAGAVRQIPQITVENKNQLIIDSDMIEESLDRRKAKQKKGQGSVFIAGREYVR